MTEPTETKRAWTPGPWLYRAKSGSWHTAPDSGNEYSYGRAFITTPDVCDMEFANDADAALIALAPDLAECVLTIADSHQMGDGFCGEMPDEMRDMIDDLADRLRAIAVPETGGDHE